MVRKIFPCVWFLPEENRWRDMNPLAMRDSGRLVVDNDSLAFEGKKDRVYISDIRRISYGKQGRDFVNNWVRIEYGEGRTAFFADGRWLGWAGIFGGTRTILDAVCHLERQA